MRYYFADKSLMWYTTKNIMLLEQVATISWSQMQEEFLQNFQVVYYLQTAKINLWNLKQKWGFHEDIEEFCDLQIFIIDMSWAESLDVFKRGLKNRIQKNVNVMVSNPSRMKKAIAIVQQILVAYGVTHGELVINFWN